MVTRPAYRMQISRNIFDSFLTTAGLATFVLLMPAGAFAQDAGSPGQEQPPLVRLSETRGEMVLNGLWKFMPGQGPAAQAPTASGWGLIAVPGSWGEGT